MKGYELRPIVFSGLFCIMFLFFNSHRCCAQKEEPVPETPSNSFGADMHEYDGMEATHSGTVSHTLRYNFEFVMDPFASEQKLTVYVLNRKY